MAHRIKLINHKRIIAITKTISNINLVKIEEKELLRRCKERGITVLKDKLIENGFSVVDKDRKLIFYNPYLPTLRRRMVLGHEFSHHALNHSAMIENGLASRHEIEVEASNVASSMIIPRSRYFMSLAMFGQVDIANMARECKDNDVLETEAEDMAVEAFDYLLTEWLSLKRNCKHGFVCRRGSVCPFLLRRFSL